MLSYLRHLVFCFIIVIGLHTLVLFYLLRCIAVTFDVFVSLLGTTSVFSLHLPLSLLFNFLSDRLLKYKSTPNSVSTLSSCSSFRICFNFAFDDLLGSSCRYTCRFLISLLLIKCNFIIINFYFKFILLFVGLKFRLLIYISFEFV